MVCNELNSQLHSVPLNILNENIRVDLKMELLINSSCVYCIGVNNYVTCLCISQRVN